MNIDSDLRTSAEWYKNLQKHYDITIMDYDGWDRNNFDYSFNEEKITCDEFDRRLEKSTVMWNTKSNDVFRLESPDKDV